jgi:hypothetical protein
MTVFLAFVSTVDPTVRWTGAPLRMGDYCDE